MGGTWVWLNDSRFADNQVLLRDGTVLRRIVPSGSYEILNPAGIFTITRTPNPEDFGFRDDLVRHGLETTVVAHTGEAIIVDGKSAWRREPTAGSWSPMSMPPTSVLDPEVEWLDSPCAELSDRRILFLVYRFLVDSSHRDPDADTPVALATVDPAGGWRRYPLEGAPFSPHYMSRMFIMLPGESSHMLTFATRPPGTVTFDTLAVEFAPETGRWTSHGEAPAAEKGLLLPDGDVLVVTAWGGFGGGPGVKLYRYSPGLPDPWSQGISLPPTDQRGFRLWRTFQSLVLLPSGRILLAAVYGDDSGRRQALTMLEYDPDAEEFTLSDPDLISENPFPLWGLNLLLLPSGSVLASFGASPSDWTEGASMLYRPDPRLPRDAWRPVITTCPQTAQPGDVITITGRRFGGLSQAHVNAPAFPRTVATNYPIVRVTALNGAVSYWRTISSQPHWIGNPAEDAFHVVIPRSLLSDATYRLEVIVNGIPSLPRRIRVTVPQDPTRRFLHSGFGQRVFGNLADGAAFVITDSGIRPVPGWDTGTRKQVEQLNRQFLDAAAQLYALGQKAVNLPPPHHARPDARD